MEEGKVEQVESSVVRDPSSDGANVAVGVGSRSAGGQFSAKPPPVPAISTFQRNSSFFPSVPAQQSVQASRSIPSPMPRSVSLSSILSQGFSGSPAVPQAMSEEGGQQEASAHPMMEEGVDQGEEQTLSPQPVSRNSSYRGRSPSFVPSSPTVSASSTTAAPRVSSRSPSFSKDIVPDPKVHFQERRGSSYPFRRISVQDVSSDIGSLQKLARQGSWRAIIDKVKETRKREILSSPDEQLCYTSYHVLALMKLRNYGAAADELTALGDLDSPKFRYEENPALYPRKSGSMVTFGLRWLHAILPRWLGEAATARDRLYDLLAYCNKKIDQLQGAVKQARDSAAVDAAVLQMDSLTVSSEAVTPIDDTDITSNARVVDEEEQVKSNSFSPEEDLSNVAGSEDSPTGYRMILQRWRRRQEMVLHTALAHHLNEKEFVLALNWLEQLVKSRPSDPILLSKYGYVQLLVGDLDGAKLTFSAVETLVATQGSGQGLLANLVGRNRGLLLFSLKQYSAASKKFDAVLKQDPGDEIAANNKALCLMYSRDLVGATQVLEEVLQRSPLTALNETLVLNLCSMYELSSMNSPEAKRTLSSWIMRIAPDDFDMTCTRM